MVRSKSVGPMTHESTQLRGMEDLGLVETTEATG